MTDINAPTQFLLKAHISIGTEHSHLLSLMLADRCSCFQASGGPRYQDPGKQAGIQSPLNASVGGFEQRVFSIERITSSSDLPQGSPPKISNIWEISQKFPRYPHHPPPRAGGRAAPGGPGGYPVRVAVRF